jgi:hypothetical protein
MAPRSGGKRHALLHPYGEPAVAPRLLDEELPTPLTTEIDAGSPYGNILSWTIVEGVLTPLALALLPSPTANGWIEVDQRPLGPDQIFVPTDVLAVVRTDAIVPPAP